MRSHTSPEDAGGYQPLPGAADGPDARAWLIRALSALRQGPPESAPAALEALIARMDAEPGFAEAMSRAVTELLQQSDLLPLLTESGMPVSRSLGKELSARLRHKLLPPLREAHDFRRVIDEIFPGVDDHRRVAAMGRERWGGLFARIRMGAGVTRRAVAQQVLLALDVLSVRLAQYGCEPEIARYLPPGEGPRSNPFLAQQYRLGDLHRSHRARQARPGPAAGRLRKALERCAEGIAHIRSRTSERGAGLGQTFLLYQSEKTIQRMLLLLDTVDGDGRVDTLVMADHFIRVVHNEKTRHSVRAFLSQTTGQLAYQIAEHKGRKGDAFITATAAEYRAMFRSALMGGAIISGVAVLKNLAGRLVLAPFWQGLAYSLNYGAGFVAIDRLGATLATKQPAYTANAVAGAIDHHRSAAPDPTGRLVANLVKVSRSQTASFAGNLLAVFPGTWLLAAAWQRLAGSPLAAGDRAWALLSDQHPLQSPALLFACNTGVFLFLSGLIAGYVQNRMRFGRIPERIAVHPGLRTLLGPTSGPRLARFAHDQAGAFAGSLSLGFLLGMAGLVGRFFGIPFDIRHITISAANVSIGLQSLGLDGVPPRYLAAVLLGVLGIGLLNFLVSFSLAFYVAMRSRGLHLDDAPRLLRRLWRTFLDRPLDFFRPPAGTHPDAR